MFRSYHLKLKLSSERERKLDQEVNQSKLELKLKEEEQSRLLLEQELLALQQKQLHDEVMANQLHIEHKNNVLQQLKDKISKEETININQIIKEESLYDNDFETIKFQIQKTHPNFFKNLNEKALQKLTLLDLKY